MIVSFFLTICSFLILFYNSKSWLGCSDSDSLNDCSRVYDLFSTRVQSAYKSLSTLQGIGVFSLQATVINQSFSHLMVYRIYKKKERIRQQREKQNTIDEREEESVQMMSVVSQGTVVS